MFNSYAGAIQISMWIFILQFSTRLDFKKTTWLIFKNNINSKLMFSLIFMFILSSHFCNLRRFLLLRFYWEHFYLDLCIIVNEHFLKLNFSCDSAIVILNQLFIYFFNLYKIVIGYYHLIWTETKCCLF